MHLKLSENSTAMHKNIFVVLSTGVKSNSLGDLRPVISCVLTLNHRQMHQSKWTPGNYRTGSKVCCFCIYLTCNHNPFSSGSHRIPTNLSNADLFSWNIFNFFFSLGKYETCFTECVPLEYFIKFYMKGWKLF